VSDTKKPVDPIFSKVYTLQAIFPDKIFFLTGLKFPDINPFPCWWLSC